MDRQIDRHTGLTGESPSHQLSSCHGDGTICVGSFADVADVLNGCLDPSFGYALAGAGQFTHHLHLITVEQNSHVPLQVTITAVVPVCVCV